MNLKNFLAGTIAIAGLAATAPVLAQDTGFYVGAGLGWVDWSIDNSTALAIPGLTSFSSDNSSTGWKIYGGYQFHRNFGVEAGYVDLGSIGVRGTATVGGVNTTFAGDADVTAWTLALTGTLPMNQQFDLTGKLGFYNWDAGGGVAGAAPGISAGLGASDTGTDFLGGLGVRYNINKNVGIGAEWEYFGGSDKANFYSINLRYKF